MAIYQRPVVTAGERLTDFFQVPFYCQAYKYIKDCAAVTKQQRQQIELNIAESADALFNHPEWGPMNRAMLRVEGLLLAAQLLPGHVHAQKWLKMSRAIAADSWGKWEEEDAQIYHPVWICSLIRYADALDDPSLFRLPTVRYYFDYFVHLISPAGMVVDFGDARWNENWASYTACLERAAAEYDRGDYKWAAQRITNQVGLPGRSQLSVRAGMKLADAYRWADDSLETTGPPATLSEEVLEDVIGKKIVFRDGWDQHATFLMLNYRDEGDWGLLARDFLRHTIPVEEEKMHHGHADENAICLLMNQGSILLHEAGYRNAIPSGPNGEFRADYFHNRLVTRTGKRAREQGLCDYLRNSGAYHQVTTEKIDFTSFDTIDVSRTRVTDPRTGVQNDRVITYLKEDDIFIVFDIIKMLETDYFTFSTLWHATTLLEQGEHHFVTAVDQIQDHVLPQNRALLIDFLQGGIRRMGTFPLRRHYQDEISVYQTLSSHYYAGHIETFVTVLAPVERDAEVDKLVASIRLIESAEPRAGVGVAIAGPQQTRYICVKTDLRSEILAANVRPRYTFESGKVTYGPIETDAYFFYGSTAGKELTYAATHLVGIKFNGKEVFAAHDNTFALMPDDLGTGFGPSKWRSWFDTVEVE